MIVDAEQNDWNLNQDGEGCVNFLNSNLLDSIMRENNQPQNILEQCEDRIKDILMISS